MKEFCYWETEWLSYDKAVRRKMLLICDDKQELVGKYNLTMMGLESVNSFREFATLFCESYYD